MPYPKEFPHSILNIGRRFSKAELVKALGLANAKEVRKYAAKHTTAFHDLSNNGTRLEYEIMLPTENTDMELELTQLIDSIPPINCLPSTCPDLSLPPPLSGMTDTEFEVDYNDIDRHALQIHLSDKYDDVGQVRLPVVFDK
jgi:hypothetical protein